MIFIIYLFTLIMQDLIYYHMLQKRIFLVDFREIVWSKILSLKGSYYLHLGKNTCDVKYEDSTYCIFKVAWDERSVALLSGCIPKLKTISLTMKMNIFAYKVDSNSWLDLRFVLHYLSLRSDCEQIFILKQTFLLQSHQAKLSWNFVCLLWHWRLNSLYFLYYIVFIITEDKSRIQWERN